MAGCVASDARPDVNPTKRDTYVIIDGVRKRVTDDVSDRRYHQSGTASADQWDRTSARATYSQGAVIVTNSSSSFLFASFSLAKYVCLATGV